MSEPKLHLDADASRISLIRSLIARGRDVTRTPNEWMPLDATDEQQLPGATAHDCCIFTYNIRDFLELARRYPAYGGIILSAQKPLPEILGGLDRLLRETNAADWPGQVRWLNDWM